MPQMKICALLNSHTILSLWLSFDCPLRYMSEELFRIYMINRTYLVYIVFYIVLSVNLLTSVWQSADNAEKLQILENIGNNFCNYTSKTTINGSYKAINVCVHEETMPSLMLVAFNGLACQATRFSPFFFIFTAIRSEIQSNILF